MFLNRKVSHMNLYQTKNFLRFSRRLFSIIFIFIGLNSIATAGIFDEGDPEAGKKAFNANCASCHNIDGSAKAAPGLGGIEERWGSTEEMMIKWIQNPGAALKTGDPYITSLVETYRGDYGLMSAQVVTEQQIKDILAYIQNPPTSAAAEGGDASGKGYTTIVDERAPEGEGNTMMIMILIVIFLIIIVSLSNISRTLKNVQNASEEQALLAEMSYAQRMRAWMWKRRVFVGIMSFIVFCAVITFGYIDLMGIGVYEAYEPEQPIYFNHAVHAQKHEIDCEYCHFTARKSRHASIPHAMLCMNCHKEVHEGAITGTTEIAKIHEAVGFNTETNKYDLEPGDPIKWNKVHNLPDHVFFSHKQHVEVGGVDCKQCHGPVDKFISGRISPVEETNAQDLPGLIQLSKPTLTMGWCIECHKESKIDMSKNGYYEEMHARMIEEGNDRGNEEWRKINEDNKITVKEMGGWECAKCHY